MQPTSLLANSVAPLVKADTTKLAAAAACKLHLAQAAFVPALTLLIANLTEATFAGYGALSGAAGVQISFFDPASGNQIVEMQTPGGGWLFLCTGTTGLPQTIYGSYLTDNGNANLYGSQLLPTPLNITASGQAVEIANARFVFPPSPMT